MKLRKILIRVGAGLLLVVGLVLVVRAVLNFTEGRALAKSLAGLKAEGIPLTAKELAPACPDEDNGARLWKAFENIATLSGRKDSPPGIPPHNNKAGDVGSLISRAWNDYTAGQPITPADRAALKDVIHKNERALSLLAEMGNKPCFLYRDPSGSLMESRTPNSLLMIRTAKLLVFASFFRAEDGDVHGAVATLLTGLKLAPLAAGEGSLIAYLISAAGTRFLSQPIGEICRGRVVAAEDLVRLIAALDPGPWPDRLAAAWRGERVMFLEAGEYLLKGSLADLGSIWEGPPWREKFGLWIFRPLVKRDMRRSLPSFEWLEAQAKLPYFQNREALRSRDNDIREVPWYGFLTKMMIGGAEPVFMKTAQIEAIMLASRAGLACRLYKSRTGRYPERLEELVPALLPEVPIDPFTGKPLVYRRDGEGCIVYSLGSNQRDDGGRSTYMIDKLVMDKDDDWSWKEDR
jgi:hypothetical protein